MMESVDTDFEGDSEIEDLSPRYSLNSTEHRSETSISSFDELNTPNLESNGLFKSNLDVTESKPVEGPRGPHLFRGAASFSTMISEPDIIEDYYFNFPSILPEAPGYPDSQTSIIDEIDELERHYLLCSSTNTIDEKNFGEIAWWTPQQVAKWIFKLGLDSSIARKFELNDISGAILIALNFDDLIELGISSFETRTKVWNEIDLLRNAISRSLKNQTLFEDEAASTRAELFTSQGRDEYRHGEKHERNQKNLKKCCTNHVESISQPTIKPLSIVGIEQLVPKPHKCAKGANCSKWRRQQRLIENFYRELAVENNVDQSHLEPGIIRSTATSKDIFESSSSNLDSSLIPDGRKEVDSKFIPSQLEEANLRMVNLRDPQENVKQFIESQHKKTDCEQWSSVQQAQKEEFHARPSKLNNLSPCAAPSRMIEHFTSPLSYPVTFSPHRMDRAAALSPELQNEMQSSYETKRLGTPSSESDISRTVMQSELEPVARKISRSVPPNLSSTDRYCRHAPYVNQLSRVDEDDVVEPPCISNDRTTQAGWMMKRKNKILRYDWRNYYFSLQGTQLTMHKHERSLEAMDYIDIDDYAVACSSFASGSKLNTALKAMSISRDKEHKQEAAAFAFQLVPATTERGRDIWRKHHKAHHFAVRSRDERIEWMREMMLAKALNQKSQGYEININGNVT
ncbi:putative ph domain-containing protein [Golovinomyces cichoracearum]|uniref:Putative ph domain-containing protein n=1 Tax=Golovinomyces cichoracearum TaxID=62708 RepID=A0A420HY22_9PEZI|nr:putative ph domain-containing protein [Golovinomyces cichoracearum]